MVHYIRSKGSMNPAAGEIPKTFRPSVTNNSLRHPDFLYSSTTSSPFSQPVSVCPPELALLAENGNMVRLESLMNSVLDSPICLRRAMGRLGEGWDPEVS